MGDIPNASAELITVSAYFWTDTPRRIFSSSSSENCSGACCDA